MENREDFLLHPTDISTRIKESGIEELGEADLLPLFRKAKERLEKDTIKPENFTYYDKAMIEEDLERARKIEEIHHKRDTVEDRRRFKFANILEAIANDGIGLEGWLGEKVATIKTSKFDDYVNGYDLVAEIEHNQPYSPSYLGFGVDVTYGHYLIKKLKRIKKEIEKGELGEIKYFESPSTGDQGTLKNIPRLIIGVDTKRLTDLAALWYDGKHHDLANHPAQIIFIEEILMQCRVYRDYAAKIGQTNLVSRYEQIIQIIKKVKEEKKSLARELHQKTGFIPDDDIFYQTLEKNLKDFEEIDTKQN